MARIGKTRLSRLGAWPHTHQKGVYSNGDKTGIDDKSTKFTNRYILDSRDITLCSKQVFAKSTRRDQGHARSWLHSEKRP